jgi:hypothetical protein
MLGHLIEIIARLWHTDAEMRRRSLLGESDAEKRIGRRFGFVCAGLIMLLVIVWLLLA